MANLAELMSTKVSQNFIDGSYDSIDTKIPLEISDLVFAKLKSKLRFATNFDKIVSSLAISKVEFDREFPMKEEDFQWLREQHNLRHFSMTDNKFKYGNWYEGDYKDLEGKMYITNLIMHAFNKTSRRKMRCLRLTADLSLDFHGIYTLRFTLPNLEKLDVSFSDVDSIFISTVAIGCPNLISLDVSDTLLKNLTDISSLKKLRFLAMRNARVWQRACLEELGSMESLEVLDVAMTEHRGKPEVFHYLDETVDLFPNLRAIDCSGMNITRDGFEKLHSLPHLRQISILDTSLNYLELDERVLNCATLSTSLRTLKWYTQCGNVYATTRVLKCIEKEHRATMERMSSECIREMCRVVNKFYEHKDQRVASTALSFLREICSNCQSLATIDAQRIVALFHLAHQPHQKAEKFRMLMWGILSVSQVLSALESPEVNVVSILEIGMRNYLTCKEEEDDVHYFILEIFHCVLSSRKIPKEAVTFRTHLMKMLFNVMSFPTLLSIRYEDHLAAVLAAVRHDGFREEFVRNYLENFVAMREEFDKDEEIQVLKLKTIREVARRIDQKWMSVFCHRLNLIDLINLMPKSPRPFDYLSHLIFTIIAFLRIKKCPEQEVVCFKYYVKYRTFSESLLQQVKEDEEEMMVLREIMSSEWPTDGSALAISTFLMRDIYKDCL